MSINRCSGPGPAVLAKEWSPGRLSWPSPLVRQAKLGVSDRVKVPVK